MIRNVSYAGKTKHTSRGRKLYVLGLNPPILVASLPNFLRTFNKCDYLAVKATRSQRHPLFLQEEGRGPFTV